MSAMREGGVLCLDPHGWHRMRYTEWGDPRNPRVLVCAHGLTRCGRDFDYLAERLCDMYRVVCPDVVGRGRSDWLREPKDYTYPAYLNDMAVLLASLHAETVDWIGTSMGGIIGMLLAAAPGSPIRKLVMNDIGCVVPQAALQRIGQYVGKEPSFDTLDEYEAMMREFSPFGELTEEQWRHLALHVAKQGEDGRWRARYDPGIAVNFDAAVGSDVDLRSYWNALHGPVLVVRGAESDLLLAQTLDEMMRRPRTESYVVARTGHPPMLMNDEQVARVRHFLLTA
ncbi:MAG TPA: alpha/beta hydrolase [Usitatibacter sp.]|nr:alpha/beta hydrolase [Usitatibacter sp.]